MKNVSDKSCKENQNTHFMPNVFFNRVVDEIMWNNTVAIQATDDNMAYARFMPDT
jgi:hypothetical protein